ncbi:MAG: hypothetical protein ACPG19_00485 [Saprospiraceae bacterium]
MNRNLLLIFLFSLSSLTLVAEQAKNNTIPKCYCDCIDTTKIKGNKDIFFKNFESDILKISLKKLLTFDKEEYHVFFTELYNQAFHTTQYTSETHKGYVNYPPNPICELLEVYLRTRIQVEQLKKIHKTLADTLNLNKDIENLKYRIWVSPTFCKQKILDIYIDKKSIEKNRVVKYTSEKSGYMGWTDVKIERIIILKNSTDEWKNFLTKTKTYNLPSLLQQMDEIRFKYSVRDGANVIVEIYDKGKLVHLLDYYAPIGNVGRSEHSKIFKEFFKLVKQTFVLNTCE